MTRRAYNTKVKVIQSKLPLNIPVHYWRNKNTIAWVTLVDWVSDHDCYRFYTQDYHIYKSNHLQFFCPQDGTCCLLDDAYDRARGKSEPLLLVAVYLRESEIHNHVLLDAYNMLTAIARFLVG